MLSFFKIYFQQEAIALIKFGSILKIDPASLKQALLAKDIFVINIENMKMDKILTLGKRIYFYV